MRHLILGVILSSSPGRSLVLIAPIVEAPSTWEATPEDLMDYYGGPGEPEPEAPQPQVPDNWYLPPLTIPEAPIPMTPILREGEAGEGFQVIAIKFQSVTISRDGVRFDVTVGDSFVVDGPDG